MYFYCRFGERESGSASGPSVAHGPERGPARAGNHVSSVGEPVRVATVPRGGWINIALAVYEPGVKRRPVAKQHDHRQSAVRHVL